MLATPALKRIVPVMGRAGYGVKNSPQRSLTAALPRFAHREPLSAPRVAVLVMGRLALLSGYSDLSWFHWVFKPGQDAWAITPRQSRRWLLKLTQHIVAVGQGTTS